MTQVSIIIDITFPVQICVARRWKPSNFGAHIPTVFTSYNWRRTPNLSLSLVITEELLGKAFFFCSWTGKRFHCIVTTIKVFVRIVWINIVSWWFVYTIIFAFGSKIWWVTHSRDIHNDLLKFSMQIKASVISTASFIVAKISFGSNNRTMVFIAKSWWITPHSWRFHDRFSHWTWSAIEMVSPSSRFWIVVRAAQMIDSTISITVVESIVSVSIVSYR